MPSPPVKYPNPKLFTCGQVVSTLAKHIRASGLSDGAWARKHGIPEAQLSRVLNFHRPPTTAMLIAIGMQRAHAYERITRR